MVTLCQYLGGWVHVYVRMGSPCYCVPLSIGCGDVCSIVSVDMPREAINMCLDGKKWDRARDIATSYLPEYQDMVIDPGLHGLYWC